MAAVAAAPAAAVAADGLDTADTKSSAPAPPGGAPVVGAAGAAVASSSSSSSSAAASSSSAAPANTTVRIRVALTNRGPDAHVMLYNIDPFRTTVLHVKRAIHACGYEPPDAQCLFCVGAPLSVTAADDHKLLSSVCGLDANPTALSAAITDGLNVQLVVVTSAALANALQLDEKRAVDLALAAHNGHVADARKLLALGADPNFRQKRFGLTALLCGAMNGHTEVVQLLLTTRPGPGASGGLPPAMADPNVGDARGKTALMYAAQHGHTNVVAALLAHAGPTVVDVNAATKADGMTALHYAARHAHFDVCRALCTAHARVLARATPPAAPPAVVVPNTDTAAAAAVAADTTTTPPAASSAAGAAAAAAAAAVVPAAAATTTTAVTTAVAVADGNNNNTPVVTPIDLAATNADIRALLEAVRDAKRDAGVPEALI